MSRAIQSYLQRVFSEFNPKASLLVCSSSSGMSRAVIGFSASGNREVKQQIIYDRKEYLPVLKEVQPHDIQWPVGNCAEDETLAHLQKLEKSFILQHRHDLANCSGMTAARLTVDLRGLTPHGPCKQCGDLFYKLRSESTVILLP